MNKQLVTPMLLWLAVFAGSLIGTLKGIENHSLWLILLSNIVMAAATLLVYSTVKKKRESLRMVPVRAVNRSR